MYIITNQLYVCLVDLIFNLIMETHLICRVCGGNGVPSTGIVNFHNIQTSDKTKEFITKQLPCIKCEKCGHSWIPKDK